MLQITIPSTELWDEAKCQFMMSKEQTLQLEHSLVSISKWESKWHKPFLSGVPKTNEETLDYVRCMTLTKNIDPKVYNYLSPENIKQINAYIEDPMTASTVKDITNKRSREKITSETIYSWMITLNIPVEFQKWHLNRLLALIRVCNVKNQPRKRMSKTEIMRRNSELNEQRKEQLHTKG